MWVVCCGIYTWPTHSLCQPERTHSAPSTGVSVLWTVNYRKKIDWMRHVLGCLYCILYSIERSKSKYCLYTIQYNTHLIKVESVLAWVNCRSKSTFTFNDARWGSEEIHTRLYSYILMKTAMPLAMLISGPSPSSDYLREVEKRRERGSKKKRKREAVWEKEGAREAGWERRRGRGR